MKGGKERERGYEGKQDRQMETERRDQLCCLWHIHQWLTSSVHTCSCNTIVQLTLTGAHAGGRRSTLELLRLLLKRP